MRRPACWDWPVTTEAIHAAYLARSQRDAVVALQLWQRGLCALCGDLLLLVVDHDHVIGEIRGLLCMMCNAREGRNITIPVVALYQQIHPAFLLDLHVPYTGNGTTTN